MRRFHMRPEDLLVVDDAQLACQMAEPVGVDVAFAAWGKQDFPELSEGMRKNCRYTFQSTQDLETFLFE